MGKIIRGRAFECSCCALTIDKIFNLGGCIQKFPDWPPGARTANGTSL
jgi:hypothetical protein